MEVTVKTPKRLESSTILAFPSGNADEYIIDAKQLAFVEPFGLVQLSLLLQRCASEACPVRFIAPDSLSADSYLARMDFYAHIPSKVQLVNAIDPDSLGRGDRGDVLIPLKHFWTPTHVDELALELTRFLQAMRLPGLIFRLVWGAVNELCGNAASHSGSKCG